jgi:hypothetical protein
MEQIQEEKGEANNTYQTNTENSELFGLRHVLTPTFYQALIVHM